MLVTFFLELLVVIPQVLDFQIDLDLNPDLFSANQLGIIRIIRYGWCNRLYTLV